MPIMIKTIQKKNSLTIFKARKTMFKIKKIMSKNIRSLKSFLLFI